MSIIDGPAGSAPRRRLLRSDAGTSHVAGHWRKLTHSAELMVDPGRGARWAIRDNGAPGAGHSHWTVTVFGETEPVAVGRTAELRRHCHAERGAPRLLRRSKVFTELRYCLTGHERGASGAYSTR